MNLMKMRVEDRLDRDFMAQTMFGYQQMQHDKLKNKAEELRYIIEQNIPEGKARDLALANLEQAIHWAEVGMGHIN